MASLTNAPTTPTTSDPNSDALGTLFPLILPAATAAGLDVGSFFEQLSVGFQSAGVDAPDGSAASVILQVGALSTLGLVVTAALVPVLSTFTDAGTGDKSAPTDCLTIDLEAGRYQLDLFATIDAGAATILSYVVAVDGAGTVLVGTTDLEPSSIGTDPIESVSGSVVVDVPAHTSATLSIATETAGGAADAVQLAGGIVAQRIAPGA